MRILLLSAYDGLSHRYWRQGLVAQFPQHHWTELSLPARFFRYRVRANPLTWLAANHHQLVDNYDVLIATSLVDIATLRGLVPSLATTPLWLYCHENQFAYPPSPQKDQTLQHDLEAKMVFLYGCLAADKISFNSQWNKDSALAGINDLLQLFPEKFDTSIVDSIAAKSDTLPVPINSVEQSADAVINASRADQKQGLKLVWNHRWEYDKGPDSLLALIQQLAANNFICQVNIVGQQFRQTPDAFGKIERIINDSDSLSLGRWGYIDSRDDYFRLLNTCDVVISTALHDFQGIAVLEAVQAGCVPLLPNQLVYPEIFSECYLYTVADQPSITAVHIYNQLLAWQRYGMPAPADISPFEWPKLLARYNNTIESF